MRDLFLKMEKRLLALLLCVVMVLGCLAGCRTNKGGSDNGVNNEVGNEDQDNNNGEMGDVEIGGDEDSNEDEGTNENEEASGENDGSQENGDSNSGEGNDNVENGDASDSNEGNEGTTGDESGDTSGEEDASGNEGSGTDEGNADILGSGTAEDPYSMIPEVQDDKMVVTTLSIPSGGTLYYSIQRIGGMILVIEDANAFVIDTEGIRHDAVNGVVTFEVADALASDFVTLQIGNAGGTPASFTIQFLNKEGSYGNPTSVSSLLNNSYQLHLEAGNSVGHYYKYYAEKDGIIRFSIESITDGIDGGISITNNRNSANRTLGADGDGTYVEIEVQAGDELMIIISVLPDRRGKYKEADITWHAEYAE